jgi:hypothetical protein
MKTRMHSPGNGKSVAVGGKTAQIKSFNQGGPKPGPSAWRARNQGGGKQNLRTTGKGV